MNILGCLDQPTRGTYVLGGKDVSRMDDDELAMARNSLVGFVFQSFNLLPRTTALDNVMLPLVYAGTTGRERRRRIACTIRPMSCPGGNSSASRLPAPW